MSVLAGNINVSKIEKERLFEGQKGKYLDIVIFLNDETDEYGNNGMIVQSVSKEERKQGIKGPILGNVKIIGNTPAKTENTEPEDMPF